MGNNRKRFEPAKGGPAGKEAAGLRVVGVPARSTAKVRSDDTPTVGWLVPVVKQRAKGGPRDRLSETPLVHLANRYVRSRESPLRPPGKPPGPTCCRSSSPP